MWQPEVSMNSMLTLALTLLQSWVAAPTKMIPKIYMLMNIEQSGEGVLPPPSPVHEEVKNAWL